MIYSIITILSYGNSTNFLKSEVIFDETYYESKMTKECNEERKNSEYNICYPEITLSNYKKNLRL